MSYLESLRQTTNKTLTENGAVSNASTLDPVLDFFSRAGAMRGDLEGAVRLFAKAYASDKNLALKAAFYMRDVRGGQGERDLFRGCMKWLAKNDEAALQKVGFLISTYGRWDDVVLLLEDAPELVNTIKGQLDADKQDLIAGNSVSLLAKWLPSENTSSKATQKRAHQLMKLLDLKPAQYRRLVVNLRKHIQLLEQKMSAGDWDAIDYEKIPSQAHRKHVKAFYRHDQEGYAKYLEAVEKGEKTIKADTLFTYEVFDTVQHDEKAANALWANLPDFTNGQNALVIADVSGSMAGRPMSISVSLALYFAERNQGLFKDHFMTFSERPEVVKVLGANLAQRLQNIENSRWGYNTNLEAAFLAILEAAVKAKSPENEMPAVLYIISDMEFDHCVEGDQTNYDNAKRLFEEAGYKLPHVVFWNVNSRNDQVPATMYDNGVTLVSGASQSTFQYAVEGKTPLESMTDILNSDRYSPIHI